MRNAIASAAILGAAAVSASPYGPLNGYGSGSHSSQGSASATWGSSYPSSTGYGSGSGQIPFKFPLSNGFPNPSNASLRSIEEQAHGTLPSGLNNGNPVTDLGGATTVFQLIHFNELFEVAFFTSLIQNITSGHFSVDGPVGKDAVLEALTVIQGQEELHALGAGGILMNAGQSVPDPCEYIFPSNSFDEAIAFAQTFTDVVESTLQAGQLGLIKATAAGADANAFITLLAGVMGQEGEQLGFFREQLNLVPSELPFLTLGDPIFAFSTLNQNVIVPGSCQGEGNKELFGNITILGELTVDNLPLKLADQDVQFTIETNSSVSEVSAWNVAFLNAQNLPVISPIKNVKASGKYVTFDAWFPAATNIADGLTISAVVDGSAATLVNASTVAAAAKFGPGLIEIN